MVSNNEDEMYVPSHEYAYVVPVKFHNATKSYSFGTDDPDLKSGDWVVVETVQGIEMGECQAGSLSVKYHPSSTPLRPVLRLADRHDKEDYEDNFRYAEEAMQICQEEISDLKLSMHLLSASYLLDRSKILFIYTAEQRVDFRELLKRLGARLHCRIELRQIGDRDQAKMVGAIGMCGMECCCSRFKTRFDNISINMAKNQQLALNIEKLSGMCGKLMCCLKYENDNYLEMTEGLPKLGAHIEYEGELYRVSSINVIANEARIENSETYQNVSIQDLREKAIIRKGVTIKKAADGTRPKRKDNGKAEPKQMIIDTRQVGISSMSKDTSQNGKNNRPLGEKKNRDNNANSNAGNNNNRKKNMQNAAPAQKQEKRPNANANNNNNNNHRRRNNPRRPEKPNQADNPNITVRSFKSSKTRTEEKGN